MKIKTILSLSLFLFFLVSGNIILFGIVNQESFFLVYLFYGFLFLTLFTFIVSDQFKEKSDLFFLIFFLFLLLFPLSYYTSNVKSYYDISTEVKSAKNEIILDIGTITDKNNYYLDYITYLESQIDHYQNNSAELEARIKEINSQAQEIEQQYAQETLKIDDFKSGGEEYEDD